MPKKGVPLTEQHKDKIRRSMENKPKSEAHKLNIKLSMLDKSKKKTPQLISDYQKARRIKIKIELIQQYGGKCCKCGILYNGKNHPIFDFHHTNPMKKSKESRNNNGCRKERISQEDCILVCANCHRMIHSSSSSSSSS